MLTLITGGARSGKSTFAQSLCPPHAHPVYIATAVPIDDEMRERIAKHRAARQPCWRTVEEPVAVPATVEAHTGESDFILIDCLTLWLNNLLLEWREEPFAAMESKASGEAQALITAARRGTVVAVTNEVGSGIVPEPPLARQFRDLQGLINQQVARAAEKVYLLTCGIAIQIKPGRFCKCTAPA
ncbi:MAG TPA: bifunctional adenosylcobinamide kinase/adenosylcobinamide-phosphate guanylyltransferase [Bryobacteraceae bacterium]|jgi:adenosylcobinamide kinase/adenosylcobinamide-phosphate guanylyltransferase|nr:bifunctional adenosylcobinamide kinase/adenosylcobinamide-phosphate guanylyltransferase [Bryobacteraceae bacterium]